MNIFDVLDQKRDSFAQKYANKEIKFPLDLVCGIVMAAVALFLILSIEGQIEISDKDTVNGREFPYLITYLMLACSAYLILKDAYKIFIKHESVELKTINVLVEIKAFFIIGILVLTYFIASITDLFIVGALFCSLAFLLYFRCRKILFYVITLSFTIAIYCIFKFGLNVNF